MAHKLNGTPDECKDPRDCKFVGEVGLDDLLFMKVLVKDGKKFLKFKNIDPIECPKEKIPEMINMLSLAWMADNG